MADKKNNVTRIITPRFVAKWAWLSTPNTKHDKDGKYEVAGEFDPKVPEHRAFLGQLKKLYSENVTASRAKFKPSKKDPQMKTQLPYEEQEDGKYLVRFSESAFIEVDDKAKPGQKKIINLKPPTVDASGQPTDVEVWSGSEIKVAIDAVPFYNGSLGAGVSRRLKGVQVIVLRTRGSRDGASLGFGVEEGGFTGNGSAPVDFSGAADAIDEDDDFLGGDEEQGGDEPAAEPTPQTGTDEDFDF